MEASWLARNGVVLAFYVVVILLLIINRKKFEFQGIAALKRTKFGVKWMQAFSKKHKETIKILGYCGIGVGFAGMIFIFGYVIKALWDFFFAPAAPAAFSLVLPGVNVPGAAIFIPLWVLVPLFIVVLIHEAGHGVVAKAFGVPIKHTGIVFFGPLAGAFVEPDEKKLKKADDIVRFSVFAAGPFANALT
jgi:membrane-associated protease RseP (regulator of RpoE activity)